MSYERVMNGPDQKYVQEAISVWSNLKKAIAVTLCTVYMWRSPYG